MSLIRPNFRNPYIPGGWRDAVPISPGFNNIDFTGGGNPLQSLPFDPTQLLPRSGGNLQSVYAQLLLYNKLMKAQENARLAQKSESFDPAMLYKDGGDAGIPHIMGLSAMARYRDMQMRANARAEAARAAVKAVQDKQAAEAAMTQEQKDAAAGIKRQTDVLPTGQPVTVIDTKYGRGSNVPLLKGQTKVVGGMTGPALQEFFQRAVNAGSPNAGVGTLPTPEPGYQGVPVNPAMEAAMEALLKKKK